MAKKQKTTKQLKNKYNAIEKITYFCEYLSMAAPFVTIGIVNYDRYFVEYEGGTKMSISMVMALAVLGLTIWSTTKEKFKNTMLSLIIKMAILSFICFMMGQLITDLATILMFGVVGLIGSQGLDVLSKHYKKKKEQIVEATNEANKDELVEKVKAEHKKKDIDAIL